MSMLRAAIQLAPMKKEGMPMAPFIHAKRPGRIQTENPATQLRAAAQLAELATMVGSF
jgi:hypothetical protein